MATSQNQIGPNGRNHQDARQVPPTDDLDRRDSREIKHRIDQTRGAMDETLDELSERLNPRNLLDDVMSVFRSPGTRHTAKRAGDAAGDFAESFGRQVRDNPIGATLVGAGLAWLAFGNRREDSVNDKRDSRHDGMGLGESRYEEAFPHDPGYYTEDDLLLDTRPNNRDMEGEIVVAEVYGEDERSSGTTDKVKRKASTASQGIADTASSTGEAIADAAGSVVDGVKSAASSVGSAVSSAGSAASGASRRAYSQSRAAARGTRRVGRRTGRQLSSATSQSGQQLTQAYDATAERVQRAHEEAPLALGLGIMALGAIAGALIPRTQREDEWMGESSDEAIRETRRQAQQAYERGQEAVANTVETAKESAKSQGLSPDSLAERANQVVKHAADSIGEAARDEGLHPSQLKDDIQTVAEDTKDQAQTEVAAAKSDAKDEAAKVDADAARAVEKS